MYVWIMSLFEHFFKVLSLYLEAIGSGSASKWKVGSGSASSNKQDPGLHQSGADPQDCLEVVSRVADPHHFHADPYPAFYSNAIRIQRFTLIRILLLIKVMEICNKFSIDPQGLHFEPPSLHCERPRLSTALSGSFCSLKCGSGSSFQKCYPTCKDMNDFRIEFSYPRVKTIRFLHVQKSKI